MPRKEIWSSWVYKIIVFSLCPAHAAYGSFHGCWRAWLMGWRAAVLMFLMYSAWQGERQFLGEVAWGKSKCKSLKTEEDLSDSDFMPERFFKIKGVFPTWWLTCKLEWWYSMFLMSFSPQVSWELTFHCSHCINHLWGELKYETIGACHPQLESNLNEFAPVLLLRPALQTPGGWKAV